MTQALERIEIKDYSAIAAASQELAKSVVERDLTGIPDEEIADSGATAFRIRAMFVKI